MVVFMAIDVIDAYTIPDQLRHRENTRASEASILAIMCVWKTAGILALFATVHLSGSAAAQSQTAAKSADSAQPTAAAKESTVDIKPYRQHMVLLHDKAGHYLISTPVSDHYTTFFYGDGKVFYQQRVFGGGLDTSARSSSLSFWEPRYPYGRLEQTSGQWSIQCGKRVTELSVVEADAAANILDAAAYVEHPWKHRAYALARDDRGNYYYVDRLRDQYGGKGFRLWIGKKGAMKRRRMTNIVSDSKGDIFATRNGELRLVLSTDSATWIRGKRRRELVNVPVRDNVELIYTELGVYYGELGTPCDYL